MQTPGSDEVEFHLATLLIDLRGISAMSSMMTRETWLYTMQPLIAHATGVCFALASVVEGDAARCAGELAQTIASVSPPEAGAESTPGSNTAAWKAIRAMHGELTSSLASSGIKPWVLGKTP
jgi:hypothetical protein